MTTRINPLDFGKIIDIKTECNLNSIMSIRVTIEIFPDSVEEIEIIQEALINNIGGAPDE